MFAELYPDWSTDRWIEYGRSLDRLKRLQNVELELSRRNPAYWIWHPLKWVWTKDEYDKDTPVKSFPRDEALLDVLCEIHEHPITFIGKSRQVMLTWLVCAYFTWWARFFSSQLLFIQSKKEEDAANLTFNKEPDSARIDFIENHLPFWMQQKLRPSYGQLLYPNGSKIWGIPQGSDTIRSYTGSALFSDEAAFQPFFLQAYRAARPSCRKIVAVSSAEPSEFGKMAGFQTESMVIAG